MVKLMFNIPDLLKDKLDSDSSISGSVITTLSNFYPWINDNKMTFFPDYTDHGVNHLNEVLNSAASLISDDSWDILSANDAAAICISTLLHDCAMHISEDGFYCLINDEYPIIKSKFFNEKNTWKTKWINYCSQASRWDGKKLKSIFGDSNPIKKIPSDKNDLTKRHRLFIGEFIRQEHASLAHSIALDGVPGPRDVRLKIDIKNANLADVFGFIARSHNLPLRQAVDKLEQSQKRTLLNIHTPYIMSILRIADYIQVNNTRANKQLLNIKKLVSPFSRGEWEKHDCIIDINQTHEDPEALFINAEPSSPIVFKSLKRLFSDIQDELDKTWSILGEVYGRYEELKKLNLNIRRIRSTLDDEQKYVSDKKPSFIPLPVHFRTSDAEMMSLLISPLYGDNPSIGVRELMQNAVDACNERIDFLEKKGSNNFVKTDIGVEIKLSKLGTDLNLMVTDRGIGMNLNVIENYFLNIGASFRNSDTWKKMHETDGHSNVHRTGRFGVGLLAAFLLGPKVEVITRHVSEQKGYIFCCEQEGGDICIKPIDCEIGTQLNIALTEKTYNQLLRDNYEYKWDWYTLDFPKVIRIVNLDGDERILDQSVKVPSNGADLSGTSWNRIEHADFDDIFWSAKKINSEGYETGLVCNGIKIPIGGYGLDISIAGDYYDVDNLVPKLVVYDQDGRMPINLQRNDVTTGKLPFNDELVKDISIKICDEILALIPSAGKELNADLVNFLVMPDIEMLRFKYYRNEGLAKLLYCNGDIFPNSKILLETLKPQSIIFDPVSELENTGSWKTKGLINDNDVYYPITIGKGSKNSKVIFLRTVLDQDRFMKGLPITGKRIIIAKKEIPLIVGPNGFPKTKWAKFSIEWENENWCILKIGNVPKFNFSAEEVTTSFANNGQGMCAFFHFDWNEDFNESEDVIFTKIWKDRSKALNSTLTKLDS